MSLSIYLMNKWVLVYWSGQEITLLQQGPDVLQAQHVLRTAVHYSGGRLKHQEVHVLWNEEGVTARNGTATKIVENDWLFHKSIYKSPLWIGQVISDKSMQICGLWLKFNGNIHAVCFRHSLA